MFPKKRQEHDPVEGIYLAADDSNLWLLRLDSNEPQRISSFASGLYCGKYYDINQDNEYEILVGSKNNKLYLTTENGETIKEVITENEVRDICIIPNSNEQEIDILVALGNNQVVLYGCAKRSLLEARIKECFEKLHGGNEISQLNELISKYPKKYHLHEFAAGYLKNTLAKDKEESIRLLEKLIESSEPSVVRATVGSAIELLKRDTERGQSIFDKLSDTRNKDVKRAVFKGVSALVGSDVEHGLRRRAIKLLNKLDEKWNSLPETDLWDQAKAFFKDNKYSQAKERCERLMESNLDLQWRLFKTEEELPISKIYTRDITDDGYPEILFRSKDGRLYCLNILGEKLFPEFNTEDTTISLSASSIIGRKPKERDQFKESKEVLYGTAKGEVVMLNEKGGEVFRRELADDSIQTIASMEDNSIRVGLRNGHIVSYQYLSDELLIDDKWYFRANNHIHSIYSLDINQDGVKELIVGSRDKHIYILKHNGVAIDSAKCSDAVCTLCVSNKNLEKENRIYVCCRDGKVNIFKFEKGKLKKTGKIDLSCGFANVYYVCDVDQDGLDEIVFVSDDNRLNIYNHEGKEKWHYDFEHTITSLGYVPYDLEDYPNLVIGFENGELACYRTFKRGELKEFYERCETQINKEGLKRIENKFSSFNQPLTFTLEGENDLFVPNSRIVIDDEITTLKNRAEKNKRYLSVIIGEKQGGKSTLLNCLQKKLSSKETVVFTVDIKGLNQNELSDFFYHFASKLFDFLREKEILLGFGYEKEDFDKNPYNMMGKFFDGCFQMLGERNLFILYDNIDSLTGTKIGKEAVEFFRKRAERHHIVSIFTASVSKELLERELNFHELGTVFYEISSLKANEIEKMMRKINGVSFDQAPLISRRISEFTEGNPYLIQLTLHQLVEECNEHRKNTFSLDDFNISMLRKITEQATSFFEYKWNRLELNQELLSSFMGTYLKKTETTIDFNALFKKIRYAEYLIDNTWDSKPILKTLFKAGGPTLYQVWIKKTWPFPILILKEIDRLKAKLPLSIFHKLDEDLPPPPKRNKLFERIELDKLSWSRVVPLSDCWDSLLNTSTNREVISQQLINELVVKSDFSFLSDRPAVEVQGDIYYMRIKIEKRTLLSKENYICVISKNINRKNLRRNIEGIRAKAESGVALIFALFEKEIPEIENLRNLPRWTVIITEGKFKELLFSKKELSDAFWDLALEQIDISMLSPYDTTEVADVTFEGRETEIDLIARTRPDRNYALIGGRKIGKTSLIHRLKGILENNPNIKIIHINCDPIRREKGDLHRALLDAVNKKYGYNFCEIDEFTLKLREIYNKEKKKAILMLDEIDDFLEYDEKHNYQFFRNLHVLSEEKICNFILVGYRTLYRSMEKKDSPLLHLMEDRRLDFLGNKGARRLIERPLLDLMIKFPEGKGEKCINKILTYTSKHPCYIQAFCEKMVDILSRRKERIVDFKLVEEVGNNIDFWRFVDRSFLEGEVITKFEKIIVYCVISKEGEFSFDDIKDSLKKEGLPFDFKTSQLEQAIKYLALANIFEQVGNKYRLKNTVLFKKIASIHKLDSLLERGDYFGY